MFYVLTKVTKNCELIVMSLLFFVILQQKEGKYDNIIFSAPRRNH
ncbi:Uncharacterised protein [Segatella oris]|uniref:Uncharacterized protein n=1 Tax=Segatella oris TaxID=28135 RepID=A0A3S4T0J6_9BACT|nr:Uncharacterised protein [Segatella oris]